jgi:hypothetical protein
MKNCLSVCFLVLLGSLPVVGCSDAVDEVTNEIDCQSVCQRYADCVDSDYDVDGCQDRCENEADADQDKERRLEMCDACLDGQSCGQSFDCTDECIGIIL